MAQQEKALTRKYHNMCVIPRTYIMEGENQAPHLPVVLLCMDTCSHLLHTHTHTCQVHKLLLLLAAATLSVNPPPIYPADTETLQTSDDTLFWSYSVSLIVHLLVSATRLSHEHSRPESLPQLVPLAVSYVW